MTDTARQKPHYCFNKRFSDTMQLVVEDALEHLPAGSRVLDIEGLRDDLLGNSVQLSRNVFMADGPRPGR